MARTWFLCRNIDTNEVAFEGTCAITPKPGGGFQANDFRDADGQPAPLPGRHQFELIKPNPERA